MRLGQTHDLRRSAMLLQQLQHQLTPGVADAAGELAVGIGPCAALAELDIAVRRQRPAGKIPVYRRVPPGHFAAPLQNHGAIAVFRQDQRRKHPCRAEAHHHRRRGKAFFTGGDRQHRRAAQTDRRLPAALCKGPLVAAKLQLHGADGLQLPPAQVQRLLMHPAGTDGAAAQGELFPRGGEGLLL